MSLLTYPELVELVDAGCIEGVPRANINGASIDVVLGDKFWIEARPTGWDDALVDLAARETRTLEPRSGVLDLAPKGFCLAQTREVFHLPGGVSAQMLPGT